MTAIFLPTANPPSMKRTNSITLSEPVQKRPPNPLEDGVAPPEVKIKQKLASGSIPINRNDPAHGLIML